MNTFDIGVQQFTPPEIDKHAGFFSPYMAISSTMQAVFGFQKRQEMEKNAIENERYSEEMRRAKERFMLESKDNEAVSLRAKMAVTRKYRGEEKFESNKLMELSQEVKLFFESCLPVDIVYVPTILNVAKVYRENGYGENCPINVVLLHTLGREISYEKIYNRLENIQYELGGVVYRRWCNRDIAHNSAIFNLHTLMSNIPTLVISPLFLSGKINFTVSLWEAQTNQKPLIRSLFSIDCNMLALSKSNEYKMKIQERLVFIFTIISGCARDTYMLMSQGFSPTLPNYIKEHKDVLDKLLSPENTLLKTFLLNEYSSCAKLLALRDIDSDILSRSEKKELVSLAEAASSSVISIFK